MNHTMIGRRILAIAGAIALLPVMVAHGQSTASEHNVGLSALLQSSQFDIQMPIWISNSLVIAPAIGLVWAEDAGSDVRLAISARYVPHREKLAPYVGLRIGMLKASPAQGTGTTDVVVGLMGGGEYFLSDQFSLGVEPQLNLTISDEKSTRFGTPGKKNLNTGAAVFATIYF